VGFLFRTVDLGKVGDDFPYNGMLSLSTQGCSVSQPRQINFHARASNSISLNATLASPSSSSRAFEKWPGFNCSSTYGCVSFMICGTMTVGMASFTPERLIPDSLGLYSVFPVINASAISVLSGRPPLELTIGGATSYSDDGCSTSGVTALDKFYIYAGSQWYYTRVDMKGLPYVRACLRQFYNDAISTQWLEGEVTLYVRQAPRP
jgi:hypothetical protein